MSTGSFVDQIQKKKRGLKLSADEIKEMVHRYVTGDIPDYQMSAMLMAICFRGLDRDELTTLTMAMRDSGEIVDLSAVEGTTVDKHSTGGVGDKTTLIVGPIVAACGVPVAKMSGRGLGFTGGTLDKLESIPGFRTDLSPEAFVKNVNDNKICIIGQTGNLVPADKLMYALRDVTGTVDSIPLIAASVMSKKLAAGSDKILLDVTMGSGAFIKDEEGARELAKRMTEIGAGAGRETVAMITGMDEPLGHAIGNRIEVREAIQTLQGEGPEDLETICYGLAGMMISLGRSVSYEEGTGMAREACDSGRALGVFRRMVEVQGGDVGCVDDPDRLELAKVCGEYVARDDGYITHIDTEMVGVVARLLGAGRETKADEIDPGAGIYMVRKPGDQVRRGDVIAYLYASDEEKIDKGRSCIDGACTIGCISPTLPKLIVDIIR